VLTADVLFSLDRAPNCHALADSLRPVARPVPVTSFWETVSF